MDEDVRKALAVLSDQLKVNVDLLTKEITEARATWVAAVTAVVVALGAKGLFTEDDIPRLIHTADTIADLLEDAIKRGEKPEEWFHSWIAQPWHPDGPKKRRPRPARRKPKR